MAPSRVERQAPRWRLRMAAAAVAVVGAVAAVPRGAAIDCAAFAPDNITVVTFDVFAALMDTPDSMLRTVAAVLPAANATTVEGIVGAWLDAYGSYFGKTFNASWQTPEPFTWVIRTSLPGILADAGLGGLYPPGSATFEALCATWGQLTPWPNTTATLARVASRFGVAALSNGDAATLAAATSVFAPTVRMVALYSSDYPVGAFKPLAPMYAQVAAQYGINHVLHVAGSPVDAYGARSYGLFAALLHEQPQPGPAPCFLLPDITALPAVLGLD